MINYALSLWNLYKKKTGPGEQEVKDIAERFYVDLRDLIGVFEENSKGMTEGAVAYNVLDPGSTAISILI